MARKFAGDIRDGTIEIQIGDVSVMLDGGNWSLTTHRNGVVSLDFPDNNPNYYEDDPNWDTRIVTNRDLP